MSLKNCISKWKNTYVERQVKKVRKPVIHKREEQRRHLVFYGRIQKVGFRYEVELLAKKMNLTGWIRNCENGTVECEIQGEKEYIDFIIHYMKTLKRMKITAVEDDLMQLREVEGKFHKVA